MIEVLDIALDTAFEVETVAIARAFVDDAGVNTLCQIRCVTQAIQDCLIVERLVFLEDCFVRPKGNFSAGFVGLAGDFQVTLGYALFVVLLKDFTLSR